MAPGLSSRVHIIGAGLAGLAAAVRLTAAGAAVTVYESAPRAGGRCRSYHDPLLDCVIDNGNHLMLSGNHAIMAYVKAIGAEDRLAGPRDAIFPFVDVATAARWSLKPSDGVIPWWLFNPARRVPNTSVWQYLSVARVMRAGSGETMTACVGASGNLYRNFWEPLTVAVLNTAPGEAAAGLMSPVLRETFLKGASACRPLVARDSLAATLVDPAVDSLTRAGARFKFGTRIRGIALSASRATALDADDTAIPLGESDTVILAAPAWIAETLLPGLTAPPPGEPIVNVHYRLPRPIAAPGEVRIVGVVGGAAQWVFARGDIASVTISAASDFADTPAEEIVTRCWPDVALALELGDTTLPPARVVKEKRATFAQTPAAAKLRPGCRTTFANLLLAGDWTDTGLPATIEGAVRSGFTAAAETLRLHAAKAA
ncbi:MAG: hydroxysqualene dehydroxylase HpnE [Rhodospirillaceae bacterium]|nr:hydroxysqualene dehydroxylase HpnE [Rhodospirillaceae bacterium]